MNAHEKCKEMAWPVVNAESGWLRVLFRVAQSGLVAGLSRSLRVHGNV